MALYKFVFNFNLTGWIKAERFHLCLVAGNTAWSHVRWRPIALWWVSHEEIYTPLTFYF